MTSNSSVKQYLLRGGLWAFGGKLFTALANMLFVALLARLVDTEEMSAFFLGQSIATFLAISGRFGVENTILRMVSEYLSLDKYMAVITTINKGLVIVIICSSLFSIIYYLTGEWVAKELFHNSVLSTIVGFTAGWIMILSFQVVYGEIFRAFQDIKSSVFFGGGVFSVISLFLLILLSLLEINITLINVLIIVILSGVINMILGFWAIRNKFSSIKYASEKNIVFYKDLLGHSWPLWINALTLFILSQSGLWIIGLYYTGIEVAGFGAATRMILLASMSLVIVNAVIPPLIAKYNAQNRKEELEKMLRTTATFAAIPALFVFILFLAFPGQLLILVFGKGYEASATVLSILTLGQIINVVVGSCGYVLMMSGNKNILMMISVFSAVIAISSGLMTVESYGDVGVAWSFFVAILVQQVLMLIMAKIKVGVWTHIGFNNMGMVVKKLTELSQR